MNDELWFRSVQSNEDKITLHRVKMAPNSETDKQGRVTVTFADGHTDWVPRENLFATKAEAVGA